MTVTVIILTRNAGAGLSSVLAMITNQSVRPDRLILLDSSSSDGAVERAKTMNVEVVTIPVTDFNHGATREMARNLTGSDVVVFMTQDALPCNDKLIEELIKPILSGAAAVSYARQIPRKHADIFEAFPRQYNYPGASNLRGIEDIDTYGVYTFFCSDSCAAYLNSALDEIGGFRPTLTNEDYFAVARLLQIGYKVAYTADAQVEHSHTYTLYEEFMRYFDTGYVRAENFWVQDLAGQAEGRGKDYFIQLVKTLVTSNPWLIPYAVVNTFVKLLGYRIGFASLKAPKLFKKLLSGQKYYWDSRYNSH